MAGVHISIPTRLLDTCTGEFIMISSSSAPPPYAILSHVWNPDGEQSYTDIRELQDSVRRASQHGQDQVHGSSAHIETPSQPRISEKIRRACAVARAHGYRYIWIDSCCIDKTSSAELSEAINSMFTWYRNASICYAFLADVPSDQNPLESNSDFSRSIWFTRGWTLQELLAPRAIVFLSRDWQVIGTKTGLARAIERITTIPFSVLTSQISLRDICVAQRMSWASKRRTTRVEDEAYSLMGIFDINMPTLYGEGQRAFYRLQEEILRRIPDQTLFAWGPRLRHNLRLSDVQLHAYHMDYAPLFANSVAAFASSYDISSIAHDELASRLAHEAAEVPFPDFTASSYGVHARLPLIPVRTTQAGPTGSDMQLYLLVLPCEVLSIDGSLVAVVCHAGVDSMHSGEQGSRGLPLYSIMAVIGDRHRGRLVVLSPDDLGTLRTLARFREVYLNLGYFQISRMVLRVDDPERGQRIHLAPWSRESLRTGGYTVARDYRTNLPVSPTHSLVLHNLKEYIKIEIDSWAIPNEPLRWLDSNTPVDGVDTRRLRLLTTVKAAFVDSGSNDTEFNYVGSSDFVVPSGPSGGSCTCDVTVIWSPEVSLWLLDIMLYYRDTSAM